ncbi:Bug family tripartite tricarboxylate transporter substrate binding protein [Polaromonas sp.]|jgi:tripartite-type tricarboxylate transporter receptor subunit TctC|uniref:Bug family tripartite tricarboxylate transporter substrate binding protein n=1 Tax=Polaromonas sp. TaxID=1869339 RepID=UPI0037CCC1B6
MSAHGFTFHATRWLALSAMGAVTMLATLPVAAQPEAYPSKPITIVVAYPPGGSTDLTGRTLAAEMSKKLGVPVVIENIGGAAGAIGAQKVVHAAPDGYTLLVGANNEIAINRLVSASVKYDLKDFTPLGLIASQPLVLVASQKSGVKTIDQFLSVVKQNPGKFSYGSSGVGSSLHLAGEMLKEQAGLFMTHIPYRGVAPLTNDLLGNNIDFGVYVLSSALPHIRSGKLVALGTTERQRSAVTPDLPALAENARLKGMDIGTWYVLMGPAQMPAPVVARLKKALNDSLQSPELRKKLEDASSTIAPLNVDMPRFLNAEVAKYKKIVDYARITE